MENSSTLDAMAEENKQKMLSLMERLVEFSAVGGIPKPDEQFNAAKRLLQKTEFNVVVCGEIKQGKSSFINSLIGKDILPTDVEVATCQVCMLSDSDDGQTESTLVFEDGEQTIIDVAKIEYYGKERGLNLSQDPLVAGKSLSYIDVRLPAKFLPNGVRIVDTPGLGALNPQHAVIAERWISLADAVVFVSDAYRSFTRYEIDELMKIYRKTPNVVIVQTKADMVSEDALQCVVNDNRSKIVEALGNAGLKRDIVIVPFSAVLLSECAKADGLDSEATNILRVESRVDDVLSTLRHLFLQTVCYYTLIASYEQAVSYYKVLQNEVAKRRNELTATDEERKKLRSEAEQKIAQFNQEWGKDGCKVREVNEYISRLGGMVQQSLQFFIGSGSQSQIYCEFCKSIDTLDNSDQISDYQENLHAWTHAAVSRHLKDINSAISIEYRRQLSECTTQMADFESVPPTLEQDYGDIDIPKLSMFEKARNLMIGVATGSFVAKIIDVGAVLLAPVTGGTSLALIAIAESTVIGVGAYRGVRVSANTALDRQRAALKKVALDDIVRLWCELRQSESFGQKSKLDQWIYDAGSQFASSLKSVIQSKRKNLQDDLDRIKNLQARLLDTKRELEKIVAIEGVANSDGTTTGLLAIRGGLISVRDFIVAKEKLQEG